MIGGIDLDMLGNDCPPRKPAICDAVSRNHITIWSYFFDPKNDWPGWPNFFGQTIRFATWFLETTSQFVTFGQKNSATNHNFVPLAKKIRQPITILLPWPKKFGNQSPCSSKKWQPIVSLILQRCRLLAKAFENFGTLAQQENCFAVWR